MEDSPAATGADQHQDSRASILLVDDDLAVQAVLRDWLQRSSRSEVCTVDRREAMGLVQTMRFDAVIVPMLEPPESFAFIQHVRALQPTAVLLANCGLASNFTAETCAALSNSNVRILPSPLTAGDFTRHVENALGWAA